MGIGARDFFWYLNDVIIPYLIKLKRYIMILQEQVQILQNKQIASGYYHLVVRSETIARNCRPGQFANIRISDSLDPLLRRPLSFFNYSTETIEFVYRVVGYGTSLLTEKLVNDTLDIIGPLGNGFNLDIKKEGKVLVVGGGMGIIPLYPLIKNLAQNGFVLEVLNGARNHDELLLLDYFRKDSIPYSVTTDDGSAGEKSYVTNILAERLAEEKIDCVFGCGPHPMLAAVAKIMKETDIPCQLSLEERMACGVGACLGCVVLMNDGSYKKVCKDGPVFLSNLIAF